MPTFKFKANNVFGAPSLASLIAKQTARIDEICQSYLLAGFDAIVQGKTYHFSYKLTDQANFAAMTNNANTSIQLSAMATQDIARPDNTGIKSVNEWTCEWNGHPATGGSVVLTLTLPEFLALSQAAVDHNRNTIAYYRAIKDKLKACTTETELETLKQELDIDHMDVDAREIREKYNVTLTAE